MTKFTFEITGNELSNFKSHELEDKIYGLLLTELEIDQSCNDVLDNNLKLIITIEKKETIKKINFQVSKNFKDDVVY